MKCKTCKHWVYQQLNIGVCAQNIIGQIGLGGEIYITPTKLDLEWVREVSSTGHDKFADNLMTGENFGCVNYEK
jgi:hypothetical protein